MSDNANNVHFFRASDLQAAFILPLSWPLLHSGFDDKMPGSNESQPPTINIIVMLCAMCLLEEICQSLVKKAKML